MYNLTHHIWMELEEFEREGYSLYSLIIFYHQFKLQLELPAGKGNLLLAGCKGIGSRYNGIFATCFTIQL